MMTEPDPKGSDARLPKDYDPSEMIKEDQETRQKEEQLIKSLDPSTSEEPKEMTATVDFSNADDDPSAPDFDTNPAPILIPD
jgi:hypothetical protein